MIGCVWGEGKGDVEDDFQVSILDAWCRRQQPRMQISLDGGDDFCLGRGGMRHSDGDVYRILEDKGEAKSRDTDLGVISSSFRIVSSQFIPLRGTFFLLLPQAFPNKYCKVLE